MLLGMAEEEEATGSVLLPLGDLGDVEGGIVLSINEDKSLVAQGGHFIVSRSNRLLDFSSIGGTSAFRRFYVRSVQ